MLAPEPPGATNGESSTAASKRSMCSPSLDVIPPSQDAEKCTVGIDGVVSLDVIVSRKLSSMETLLCEKLSSIESNMSTLMTTVEEVKSELSGLRT